MRRERGRCAEGLVALRAHLIRRGAAAREARADLAAWVALMHAVAGRAGEAALLSALGLQQALEFVGRQSRGAVIPEARGESVRLPTQRRVALERAAVVREVVAGNERI